MSNSFDFIVGLINLGLLYFVVKAFVIDPLKGVARERERDAHRRMDDAEGVLAEARTHLETYRERVLGLEAESQRIRAEAEDEARTLRDRAMAEADREAAALRSRAELDVRLERSAAVSRLKSQTAEAALAQARGLLERGLDEAGRQDIFDRFLEKVGPEHAG